MRVLFIIVFLFSNFLLSRFKLMLLIYYCTLAQFYNLELYLFNFPAAISTMVALAWWGQKSLLVP